jgi:predicted unusual protein kinase regulating ubiquinone biosynthesis (AarF/ABC1/UbiB family)
LLRRPEGGGFSGRELASRLCSVWLRQALLGRFFPAEARGRDVVVLPDGRVAFRGVFASLPSASRKDLWDYLLAASVGDPDGACAHLFRVMDKDPRSVHEDGLRHQFRQAIPPGAGGSGLGEGGNLGALVRAHWQLAQAQGCRPPLHLLRFYRGLRHVDETARRLAPDRDSLRDGLETVRVVAALGQVGDLLSLAQLNQNLEQYAPVLLELPRKLDEVLTLVAQGSARMQLRAKETAEKRAQKNSTAVAAALLFVLAGAALLARHLAAEEPGGWGAKVALGVFVAVGAVLLMRLGGGR